MKLKNLSIIIPVKNECDSLKFLIPKLKKITNDLLVIDGHSTDKTKDYCKKQNIRFYLDDDLGKGNAQRLGVKKAKNKYIVFLDGDGVHNINDIKKIYNLLKKNYDLIICSRQTGGSYDLNFSGGFASAVRASGVILLVSLFDRLFKANFTDILNGFRGVRKNSFLKLKTKENGFAIEIDILIQAVIKKQRIKEIPSRENVRKYGESKLPTIKGLYFIYFIIKQYLFYKLKID